MGRIPCLIREFYGAPLLLDDVDGYGESVLRVQSPDARFRDGRFEREDLGFGIEFAVFETDFRESSGFGIRE